MTQMGFFDLSDRYASLDAKKDPLLEIDAVVPWEEFRPALERVWRKPDADRKSRAGRKPIDAVLMFKTLVLSNQRRVKFCWKARRLEPFRRTSETLEWCFRTMRCSRI